MYHINDNIEDKDGGYGKIIEIHITQREITYTLQRGHNCDDIWYEDVEPSYIRRVL